MLTFSPIRALDSPVKPQSARLFRLKPFENKIRLVEETQPRAAEISGNTTDQLRAGAVRLYQTVRTIARDRLIGGDKAEHAWLWLLIFFGIALTLVYVCFRMYSRVQAVEERFVILLNLLQDARNIPTGLI